MSPDDDDVMTQSPYHPQKATSGCTKKKTECDRGYGGGGGKGGLTC